MTFFRLVLVLGAVAVCASALGVSSCGAPDAGSIDDPSVSTEQGTPCTANLADAAFDDGQSGRNWQAWFDAINGGCDGYVPAGTWTRKKPWGGSQMWVPHILRAGAQVYGDGQNVSIIQVDNCPYLTQNGAPPPDGSCNRIDSQNCPAGVTPDQYGRINGFWCACTNNWPVPQGSPDDHRWRCPSDQTEFGVIAGNYWCDAPGNDHQGNAPCSDSDGDNVVIRDLQVQGSGRVVPYNVAGMGIRFHWVNGGTVQRVTSYRWGEAGIDVNNSSGVQVLDNEVDIDGCMSPNSNPNTCGIGGGIGLDNMATPGLGNHLIRGNHIQRIQFEAIFLLNSSYNTIINNSVENAELGILIRPKTPEEKPTNFQQLATGNVLRNNILTGVGGPSYFNPPGNDPTRCGSGVQLQGGATNTLVYGTDIIDMKNGSACSAETHNHGIFVWTDGQSGNSLLANTITWTVRPNANTSGIWNAGTATKIDFNVVKNAPVGIYNHAERTAEVKQNALSNNGQHIYNLGTLSTYSCNRFNGSLQAGCSIPCGEGSCTLIGNRVNPDYYTGVDCTGNEYVSSSNPYTFNATGTRGNTLQSVVIPSYRDTNGKCWNWTPSTFTFYRVYR